MLQCISNSSTKLLAFKLKFLEPSLLYPLLHVHLLSFITEALHLTDNAESSSCEISG